MNTTASPSLGIDELYEGFQWSGHMLVPCDRTIECRSETVQECQVSQLPATAENITPYGEDCETAAEIVAVCRSATVVAYRFLRCTISNGHLACAVKFRKF